MNLKPINLEENDLNLLPLEDKIQIPNLPLITENQSFSVDTLKKYPKSSKKISLHAIPYNIKSITNENLDDNKFDEDHMTTTVISPLGIEFLGPKQYTEGTLLKLHLEIPDYWSRKQKYVEYGRITPPKRMPLLVKVIKSEETSKKNKKRVTLVQTMNIDSIDQQVLESYLDETKGT